MKYKTQQEKTEALVACDQSIAHWQSIAAGIGVDAGTRSCALCRLVYNDCSKCRFNELYGYCGISDNNPYTAWSIHIWKVHKRHIREYWAKWDEQASCYISDFRYKRMCLCSECVALANDVVKALMCTYKHIDDSTIVF